MLPEIGNSLLSAGYGCRPITQAIQHAQRQFPLSRHIVHN